MTQRDPDMIRVSKRQLKKLLGRTLVPKVVDAIVVELEAAPEGEAVRNTVPSADMMQHAALVLERRQGRARRAG